MFKFTIRELLLLNVIAAVVVAWILDHGRMVVGREQVRQRAEEAEKRAKEYGASATEAYGLLEKLAPGWQRDGRRFPPQPTWSDLDPAATSP